MPLLGEASVTVPLRVGCRCCRQQEVTVTTGFTVSTVNSLVVVSHGAVPALSVAVARTL